MTQLQKYDHRVLVTLPCWCWPETRLRDSNIMRFDIAIFMASVTRQFSVAIFQSAKLFPKGGYHKGLTKMTRD